MPAPTSSTVWTGDDTMDGRGGTDTYFVDSSKDKVSEDTVTGGGIDTVISKASFELDDNIENLTLLGAAVIGTGNALKNTITGNDLANTLNGGGDIDKLVGGKGDDTYEVDNAKDVVTESLTVLAGGGIDTVMSSAASFVLGTYVEHLQLIGTAVSGTGNTLDNKLTGNDKDNGLFGLAGADTLDSGDGNDTLDGGTGIDDLTGGKGDDTYMLDSKNDAFHEGAGDSGDTVAAPFNIDLSEAIYDNIENATLLGSAALSALGDSGNNYLTGNAARQHADRPRRHRHARRQGRRRQPRWRQGRRRLLRRHRRREDRRFGQPDTDEVRASVTFSLANLATIENAMLLGSPPST